MQQHPAGQKAFLNIDTSAMAHMMFPFAEQEPEWPTWGCTPEWPAPTPVVPEPSSQPEPMASWGDGGARSEWVAPSMDESPTANVLQVLQPRKAWNAVSDIAGSRTGSGLGQMRA